MSIFLQSKVCKIIAQVLFFSFFPLPFSPWKQKLKNDLGGLPWWLSGKDLKKKEEERSDSTIGQLLSHLQLFVTPGTAPLQASLSSPSPGACSNSRPLSQWCHPSTSSSVAPFSSCYCWKPANSTPRQAFCRCNMVTFKKFSHMYGRNQTSIAKQSSIN